MREPETCIPNVRFLRSGPLNAHFRAWCEWSAILDGRIEARAAFLDEQKAWNIRDNGFKTFLVWFKKINYQ